MPEIFRSRDCIVFVKDDAYTVTVDTSMAQGGWPGGQGVQWAPSSKDEFTVTYSRGKFGGYLVWGSDESADDLAATTRNQPHYRFATIFGGSSLMATSSYERYTLASRLVGPLVPLVYGVDDVLYLSLRGLWTKEDELTLSSDSQAPSSVAGYVAQAPGAANSYFLGIQTAM